MRTMPVLSAHGAAWVAERGLYREREGLPWVIAPVCAPPTAWEHADLTELELRWQHWHQECERHLQDGTFASTPPRVPLQGLLGAGPGQGPSQLLLESLASSSAAAPPQTGLCVGPVGKE